MILQKPIALASRARALLEAVPYSVLILVARAATFSVFFRSGLVKLADWNATLSLFENEYQCAGIAAADRRDPGRQHGAGPVHPGAGRVVAPASARWACWAWSR